MERRIVLNKIQGEIVHSGVNVKFEEIHNGSIVCVFSYDKYSIKRILTRQTWNDMNAKDLIDFIDKYSSLIKRGV